MTLRMVLFTSQLCVIPVLLLCPSTAIFRDWIFVMNYCLQLFTNPVNEARTAARLFYFVYLTRALFHPIKIIHPKGLTTS